MPSDPHPILLYDGVCGFCNRTVQFVLRHDSKDHFRFASLQSALGRNILTRHTLNPDVLDTIYLVQDFDLPTEHLLSRSSAVAEIWSHLDRPFNFFGSLLRWLPKVLADFGYNLIARHRYRIFGKYKTCPLPDAKTRHKFLDV